MNNTLNTTELMTGKDGRLFVEFGGKNVFLAEINTYSVVMNVNTAEKQPVGSILVHRIPTGVTFDLTFTEMVIRDDLIMEPCWRPFRTASCPSITSRAWRTSPTARSSGWHSITRCPTAPLDCKA